MGLKENKMVRLGLLACSLGLLENMMVRSVSNLDLLLCSFGLMKNKIGRLSSLESLACISAWLEKMMVR